MKFIHTLAFLLLIGYIICDNACESESNPSKDNCNKIKVEGGHCCYYETPKSTKDPKGCVYLTNYMYDNIKPLAKYWKTFGGDNNDTEDKKAKIECKSFYLEFTSIILILLLL